MWDAGYQYVRADNAFYPPDIYKELYGTTEPDDYRAFVKASDFALFADSFGSSLESLTPILQCNYEDGVYPQIVDGSIDDCIYFSFNQAIPQDTILSITWQDVNGISYESSNILCLIGDGQLLIPAGMNTCWLKSKMEDITFSLFTPTEDLIISFTYEDIKSGHLVSTQTDAILSDFKLYSIQRER